MDRLAGLLSEARVAVAATLLLVAGLVMDLTAPGLPLIAVTTYAVCYLVAGWDPTRQGLQALQQRRLDVDVLTVVAALGAAAIGQWQDGALLLVIFTTSGVLEEIATRRTERSVRALVDLAPEQAERIGDDGQPEAVGAVDLKVGDIVLVRPGERIPADGVVTSGSSDVDESAISGEPLPAARHEGDGVFAGTLNGEGALHVEVRTAAADSVVGRIAALVQEATAAMSPTQLFVERFEQRYSVGVVVTTCVLLTALPTVFGLEWRDALLRSMTFMIVASPCAIILATMPALLSAVALAGRNGVLVKGGTALEKLATVDVVVFDKTGTLTRAQPQVIEVEPLGAWTVAGLLAVAAAAESGSEHVLADAVAGAAAAAGVAVPTAAAVTALPGLGIRADVGGAVVCVGNRRLVQGAVDTRAEAVDAAIQRAGGTSVWVGVDSEIVGILGIHDRLRPGAAEAVQRLEHLGVDRIALLTGDRHTTAEALAAQVGIAEVHAELLPDEKVDRLRALQAEGFRVLAVGDGLNDAPMLATADCAAAMGLRGSDLTLERADVVLRTDRISRVPEILAVAKAADRRVKQNLVLALSAIAILVVFDLAGSLPLALGVAGHEGSTLLVAVNGMRLLRQRNWPSAPDVTSRHHTERGGANAPTPAQISR